MVVEEGEEEGVLDVDSTGIATNAHGLEILQGISIADTDIVAVDGVATEEEGRDRLLLRDDLSIDTNPLHGEEGVPFEGDRGHLRENTMDDGRLRKALCHGAGVAVTPAEADLEVEAGRRRHPADRHDEDDVRRRIRAPVGLCPREVGVAQAVPCRPEAGACVDHRAPEVVASADLHLRGVEAEALLLHTLVRRDEIDHQRCASMCFGRREESRGSVIGMVDTNKIHSCWTCIHANIRCMHTHARTKERANRW